MKLKFIIVSFRISILEREVIGMVYLRVDELLKEKKKSKYWLVKNMERRLSIS